MSRAAAARIAGIYLAVTTFTIVGNPFAVPKVVTIPLFGILLTLSWSLVVGSIIPSVSVALGGGAILNAAILFFALSRRRG